MSVQSARISTITHDGREPRQSTTAPTLGDHRLVTVVAILAFAHASVTVFWTLGGTLLLDTVGAPFDDLAREHSLGSFTLGTAVVLAKVTAALLALALVSTGTGRVRRRALLIANGAAAGILMLWGGLSVLVGALLLGGVITPDARVNEHVQSWHVFFWDPWFVLWGALLAVAVVRYRRRTA